MALTSASTDAEVDAAIDDNSDYDLVSSADKAKELIHALRIKLNRMLKRAMQGGRGGGNEWEKDTNQIQGLLDAAVSWLGNAPTSAGGSGSGAVSYADFSERDW